MTLSVCSNVVCNIIAVEISFFVLFSNDWVSGLYLYTQKQVLIGAKYEMNITCKLSETSVVD